MNAVVGLITIPPLASLANDTKSAVALRNLKVFAGAQGIVFSYTI